MTTPPPPPGSGGNQPYDPTGPTPYPGDGTSSAGTGGSSSTGSTPSGTPSSTPSTPAGGSPYPSAGAPTSGTSSYPGAPTSGPAPYGNAPTPNQYGAPQAGSNTSKTLGIVSIVTGVIGLCCCGWFIFQIAAVVTGFIGMKKAKEEGQPDTLPKIGMILGIVGIALAVLYWILVATGTIDLNYWADVQNS